jgi:hypothetical protein
LVIEFGPVSNFWPRSSSQPQVESSSFEMWRCSCFGKATCVKVAALPVLIIPDHKHVRLHPTPRSCSLVIAGCLVLSSILAIQRYSTIQSNFLV